MIKKFQLIPIILSIVVFIILAFFVAIEVKLLNNFYPKNTINTNINISDILVGFGVYIKTSIDFTLFIGQLIEKNISLISRVAIEIGTALGNALGTMLILFVWVVFKEVPILLAIMTLMASLVLLELAESGLEHIEKTFPFIYHFLNLFFKKINIFYKPLVSFIIPNLSTNIKNKKNLKLIPLFVFSLTIPFILGLDDFAGYISLFNTLNVLGFAIGVLLGHLTLNIALFANPYITLQIVKNKWISLLGTTVFIILAGVGIFDVLKIIFSLFMFK